MFAMPPAIIRDFLAQLSEMLDRVDRDLEQLRRSPQDAGATDRISGALSAIGTGAGFLHLSGLVLATASASSALHSVRGQSPEADAAALTDLSTAIAAIRVRQTELGQALQSGGTPRPDVIDAAPPEAPEAVRFVMPGVERRPLRLDDSKTPLVEFMVEDLRDAIALVEQGVDRLETAAARPAGASQLARIGLELVRTAQFFELDGLREMASALRAVGEGSPSLPDAAMEQVLPRLRGVLELLRELTDNLGYSTVIVRPVGRICQVLCDLAAGRMPEAAALLPDGCNAMVALEHDGVIAPSDSGASAEPLTPADFMSPEELPVAAANVAAAEAVITDDMMAAALASELAAAIVPHELPAAAASFSEREPAAEATSMPVVPSVPATAAPEPGRLDAAIAELGNLITQSSRLALIPEEVAPARDSNRLATRVAHISDDVSRATSDMKAAVLNARALPVGMLFAACAEAASDAARDAGESIEAAMSGAEVEIDMGVIERLRVPLVNVVADVARLARSDAEFTLSAAIDESTMSLDLRVILNVAPGASLAAAAIGELRGTVEAIRGAMTVDVSEAGRAQIHLRVPTNLAFIYCTVVRIGNTLAAIPMSGVEAVVKPEADQIVGGKQTRALLVREGAAELLDGHALFGDATEAKSVLPYAVVVCHEGKRVALACTRAVGAQEVVVRPMDPLPRRLGPISGVGASSNGSAALIVDVPALVRMAAERSGRLGIAA